MTKVGTITDRTTQLGQFCNSSKITISKKYLKTQTKKNRNQNMKTEQISAVPIINVTRMDYSREKQTVFIYTTNKKVTNRLYDGNAKILRT